MSVPIPGGPVDLKGRNIVVTGAGAGLGRAVALAAARAGAGVVLLGRTVARLEKVYDEIRAAGALEAAPEPAIVPLDLAGATWADHAGLAATLEREFGALHGIAHCAAHFKGLTPLAEHDPKDWLETLQVNLTAAFALTAHCLPLLRAGGDGSVVFVGDALRDKAFAGAYGVSKAALEALMRTWAQELENEGKVRFNSFDPGPLDTGLRRKAWVGDPAGTARKPEGIAPALLWLLSGASRGRTGEAFRPA